MTGYQYYTVHNDGPLEIHLQQSYWIQCFNYGNGGGDSTGGFPAEHLPGGGGGHGSYVHTTTVTNYNPANAICNLGSSDWAQMNQNLSNALSATGLASGVTGWTFDKADALIRSIGGTNINYKGV